MRPRWRCSDPPLSRLRALATLADGASSIGGGEPLLPPWLGISSGGVYSLPGGSTLVEGALLLRVPPFAVPRWGPGGSGAHLGYPLRAWARTLLALSLEGGGLWLPRGSGGDSLGAAGSTARGARFRGVIRWRAATGRRPWGGAPAKTVVTPASRLGELGFGVAGGWGPSRPGWRAAPIRRPIVLGGYSGRAASDWKE